MSDTGPEEEEIPRIATLDSIYFCLYLLCFLVGTIGNGFALRYFLTKKRDVATSVYIFVACADIIVSLLALPLCIPMIAHERQTWVFSNHLFCNFWGVLWYVFSIGTIFLVAILSITRTLQLAWPFRQQNRNVVVMVIVGYFAFLLVESTIPMWMGRGYRFEEWLSCTCSWRSNELFSELPTILTIYDQIYLFQAYFPIVPILISCVMTITSLRGSDNAALNRSNRSISVTIVLFTVLFMLCNVPTVFLYVVAVVERHMGRQVVSHFDMDHYYFFKFSNVLTICMNSALNPVLYFSRMKNMRSFTMEFLSKCAPSKLPISLGNFKCSSRVSEETYLNVLKSPGCNDNGHRVRVRQNLA